MRTMTLALTFAVALSATSTALAAQPPGFWSTPAIPDVGPVHVWPEASERPDPKATYQVLFDLTQAAATPDAVNRGLVHVARALNVFTAAGVPRDHLRFAVIIHGGATPVVLSDDAFRARFGGPNPNLALIAALQKAGVALLVCGNSLGDREYAPADLAPQFRIALSAVSTTVLYSGRGYVVLPL